MPILTPAIPMKEPAPEGSGRSRARRALLVAVDLVLFAAAVVGVRTLLVHLWPWEPDGEPADKLAAFAEAGDRYNAVVVGSSRVLRQVDPVTFDARMADLGYGTSTFNFGIGGMSSPEMRDYLRRIMAEAPEGLEFVVIAPEFLDGELEDENVGSIRVVAWHDTANTAAALRTALGAGEPLLQRVEWSYNHLASYLANVSGTSQLLAAAEASAQPGATGSVGPRGDGWYSLDDQRELGGAASRRALDRRHRALLRMGEDAFEAMVGDLAARAAAADSSLPPLGSLQASYLADLVAIIRSGGAEPIFMVPTGGDEYNSGWLRRAEAEGIIPVLLDFGDPRPWPDLFTFESWFDTNHLDEEASLRFSAYLAEEVAGYLRAALPGLDLPPAPTVDVTLDPAALAGDAVGLELQGSALVKVEVSAFLVLTGVEDRRASGIAVRFGGAEQAAAVLQAQTGRRWSEVGERVDAGPGREVVLDPTAAPAGAALRVRVIGGLGTSIEEVRLLGARAAS